MQLVNKHYPYKMRIKFLSIIACFLFVSIAISSCLDSEDTYVVSSDATVHAFGLDTIHGRHYKFAIDQINRRIYNLEPLPVGADTLIDSILIDTFQVNGYITSGLTGLTGQDTILNLNNHQNLTGASRIYKGGNIQPVGDEPCLKFRIIAADMETKLEYTLYLSIYEHDPDSMRWSKEATTGLPTASFADMQTAATLGDKLLLYVNENNAVKLYENSTTQYAAWSNPTLNGVTFSQLPELVKLNKLNAPQARNQEMLFATADQKVYQSADGSQWDEVSALIAPQGYSLNKLICGFENSLIGLFEKEGENYLMSSTQDITAWNVDTAVKMPEGFPTENIYATEYQTSNLLNQVMIVGKAKEDAKKIIPWAYDGNSWTMLDPDTEYKSYCLTEKLGFKPALMHYNDKFYMFGERLNFIYTSKNQLAWYESDKKFFLPKEVDLRGNYTMAIDQNQYIWLISGGCKNPGQENNEVWRGRLNKFGYNN